MDVGELHHGIGCACAGGIGWPGFTWWPAVYDRRRPLLSQALTFEVPSLESSISGKIDKITDLIYIEDVFKSWKCP